MGPSTAGRSLRRLPTSRRRLSYSRWPPRHTPAPLIAQLHQLLAFAVAGPDSQPPPNAAAGSGRRPPPQEQNQGPARAEQQQGNQHCSCDHVALPGPACPGPNVSAVAHVSMSKQAQDWKATKQSFYPS